MLRDELDYVLRVDTHRDEHVLAVMSAPAGAAVAGSGVPPAGAAIGGAPLRGALRGGSPRLGSRPARDTCNDKGMIVRFDPRHATTVPLTTAGQDAGSPAWSPIR